MRKPSHIAAVLAGLTLAFYSPSLFHGFVNFDDSLFILESDVVRSGLRISGIVWAFTEAPYSCPLAWVSHMLDVSLFGLWAGGHHLVNVLLHAANTALLFLLLGRLTSRSGPAAVVAALFAWHPLHVESVAWIAERRDVLSLLFGLLAIRAYVHFAADPGWRRQIPVFIWLLLGLLTKAMLVTLPFVLVLLDFWPLGRLRDALAARDAAQRRVEVMARLLQLALEKTPLFLLAAFFTLEGLYTADLTGLFQPTEHIPLSFRLSNALTGYVRYLGKAVWPAGLTVMYPMPESWSAWQTAAAALLLAVLTLWAWRARHSRPHLLVGWLWYLGTLVPVIGIVQGGLQSIADRYTYLPLIGVFIAVVWEVDLRVAGSPQKQRAAAWAAGFALAAFTVVMELQLRHWENRARLFGHALRVHPNGAFANYVIGRELVDSGRLNEALPHLELAARMNLSGWEINNRLGAALAELGRIDEAIVRFETAVRLNETADAPMNLGRALAMRGRHAEARARWRDGFGKLTDIRRAGHFVDVVLADARKNPKDAEWLCNLAVVLALDGRTAEAQTALREALVHSPGHAEATAELERITRPVTPMAPLPRPDKGGGAKR